MSRKTEILVVGGGPSGLAPPRLWPRNRASVTLIEKEADICPPASGAYTTAEAAACVTSRPWLRPAPSARGCAGCADGSSPFYIAPRPSARVLRVKRLFRAAATTARARAAAPVLHALHTASADLRGAELARADGDRWLYHRDGIVQAYEAGARWTLLPKRPRWAAHSSPRGRARPRRRARPSPACAARSPTPSLPRRRAHGPGTLHARHGRPRGDLPARPVPPRGTEAIALEPAGHGRRQSGHDPRRPGRRRRRGAPRACGRHLNTALGGGVPSAQGSVNHHLPEPGGDACGGPPPPPPPPKKKKKKKKKKKNEKKKAEREYPPTTTSVGRAPELGEIVDDARIGTAVKGVAGRSSPPTP